MKRATRTGLLALALALLLCGCAPQGESPADPPVTADPARTVVAPAQSAAELLCRDNEIVTYEPSDLTRQVLTVGNFMNLNTEPLEQALEAQFPEIELVFSIGSNNAHLHRQGETGTMPDLLFYASDPSLSPYFYDLSSEPFTGRYNLTSLNAISVDDRIYQLPLASSGLGIFYNKTLFDEHGWAVPETRDAFYELCETIAAEGIRPFAPCLKYAATVADVGMGLSCDALFGDLSSAERFYAFTEGEGSSVGVMEPFLRALRTLYDRGLIVEEDFSSSATQNRMAMYAGEIAMIPYSLNLVSFYDAEQPDCELGFMGFPTDVPGERAIAFAHEGTCLSLARASMEDAGKRALLLEIVDYLSTDEGQDVLFRCCTGISSLKSYQSNVTARFDEVLDCMNAGRMYFPQTFWGNEDMDVIRAFVTGAMSSGEMLAAMDAIVRESVAPAGEAEPIAVATEEFTILETACLMADAFRNTTGADIGLMLSNAPYQGVLMNIKQGPIYDLGLLYVRGLSGDNCLTVYEMTGEQLLSLLEHPYIGGEEISALYAVSGLKVTYAPWAAADGNVRSVTLADGTPIDGQQVYTVAAWDTTIDARYIRAVAAQRDEFRSVITFMEQYAAGKGSIAPARDGRITLDWETR